MERYSLAQLIGPGEVESFFKDTWGRKSVLFEGSIAAEAGGILNLASFEQLLATLNRAHEGWLHLAGGGLKAVLPDMVDEQGMLKLHRIRAAFAGGETLYLTKAERVCHPLMQLARAIELDLAAEGVKVREPVNAHVFLTPPRSQGFRLHRDEHASFILQLDGCKEWTVYEPSPEDVPTRREPLRPGVIPASSLECNSRFTYQMHPGDVIYMPEFWPHEARAMSAHSLHVTLRIFPLRWVDVLLAVCAEHPALSDALPRTAWNGDGAATLAESLQYVIDSPAFRKALPDLLGAFGRKHAVPKSVLPDKGLSQVLELDRIGLDTPLVRSAGATCHLLETSKDVCIEFPGGAIRGPTAIKQVFEFIAGATNLRAQDLPSIDGAEYDRVSVARMFVKDGLFRLSNSQ